jgi:hypothetical protein
MRTEPTIFDSAEFTKLLTGGEKNAELAFSIRPPKSGHGSDQLVFSLAKGLLQRARLRDGARLDLLMSRDGSLFCLKMAETEAEPATAPKLKVEKSGRGYVTFSCRGQIAVEWGYEHGSREVLEVAEADEGRVVFSGPEYQEAAPREGED